ncbi:MAG: type II toxin-antitoxin system ParD family antitoxin [Actinomycetales bacterium]|nr:type II toxin-antitoxin system ParD family antitoxin [Actinomycetales bacterium]
MATMNVSLPDSLKSYVDEQVRGAGYGSSSEYVRELIRRDRERARLRELLIEGASSPVTDAVGPDYFEALRERVRSDRLRPGV